MKRFLYDVILPRDEICNLIEDQKQLFLHAEAGEHIVFYGKRNRGKTSIVKNTLIADFKKKHPEALILFVDFLGVNEQEDIDRRIFKSFENAMSQIQPTKSFLNKMVDTIQSIRPVMSLNPITGELSFSLGLTDNLGYLKIDQVLQQCCEYFNEHRPCLLVFDEFQDITFVKGADARIRTIFQNLPGDLPIVILGSKKHLLSEIFSNPNAPLANWGRFMEISEISTKEYLSYANIRFKFFKQKLTKETCQYMQEKVQNNPESLNMICNWLTRCGDLQGKKFEKQDIDLAIYSLIDERKGVYLEYLTRFTKVEIKFLRLLASEAPLSQPMGKDFLSKLKTSSGTVGPILKRFLDQAIIYKDSNGYTLADPLLASFLIE